MRKAYKRPARTITPVFTGRGKIPPTAGPGARPSGGGAAAPTPSKPKVVKVTPKTGYVAGVGYVPTEVAKKGRVAARAWKAAHPREARAIEERIKELPAKPRPIPPEERIERLKPKPKKLEAPSRIKGQIIRAGIMPMAALRRGIEKTRPWRERIAGRIRPVRKKVETYIRERVMPTGKIYAEKPFTEKERKAVAILPFVAPWAWTKVARVSRKKQIERAEELEIEAKEIKKRQLTASMEQAKGIDLQKYATEQIKKIGKQYETGEISYEAYEKKYRKLERIYERGSQLYGKGERIYTKLEPRRKEFETKVWKYEQITKAAVKPPAAAEAIGAFSVGAAGIVTLPPMIAEAALVPEKVPKYVKRTTIELGKAIKERPFVTGAGIAGAIAGGYILGAGVGVGVRGVGRGVARVKAARYARLVEKGFRIQPARYKGIRVGKLDIAVGKAAAKVKLPKTTYMMRVGERVIRVGRRQRAVAVAEIIGKPKPVMKVGIRGARIITPKPKVYGVISGIEAGKIITRQAQLRGIAGGALMRIGRRGKIRPYVYTAHIKGVSAKVSKRIWKTERVIAEDLKLARLAGLKKLPKRPTKFEVEIPFARPTKRAVSIDLSKRMIRITKGRLYAEEWLTYGERAGLIGKVRMMRFKIPKVRRAATRIATEKKAQILITRPRPRVTPTRFVYPRTPLGARIGVQAIKRYERAMALQRGLLVAERFGRIRYGYGLGLAGITRIRELVIPRARVLAVGRLKPAQVQRLAAIPALAVTPRLVQIPRLAAVQKIAPIAQVPRLPAVAPVPPVPTIPLVPGIPLAWPKGLPWLERGRGVSMKLPKRKYRYVPSFAAIALGIYGKMPKRRRWTGFEIRKIPLPRIKLPKLTEFKLRI